MKRFEFKTFEDFVGYTSFYKNDNKIRLYRGQKEDWPLESKLLRLVEKKNRINEFYKIEKAIFNEFKMHYVKVIGQNGDSNDWGILSLAQHYGLPTRLIDWSSDPLVALWFAFEEEKENTNDRIVWGFVVED